MGGGVGAQLLLPSELVTGIVPVGQAAGTRSIWRRLASLTRNGVSPEVGASRLIDAVEMTAPPARMLFPSSIVPGVGSFGKVFGG